MDESLRTRIRYTPTHVAQADARSVRSSCITAAGLPRAAIGEHRGKTRRWRSRPNRPALKLRFEGALPSRFRLDRQSPDRTHSGGLAILWRSAEVARQTHGSIHRDSPLSIDNGADPVHRNTQGTRQLVQADIDFLELVFKQFARMNGRQFPSLWHLNQAAINRSRSTLSLRSPQ